MMMCRRSERERQDTERQLKFVSMSVSSNPSNRVLFLSQKTRNNGWKHAELSCIDACT